MLIPFVWFDNIGPERSATTKFLGEMFQWSVQDSGPMTFLTQEGQPMPFAATCDQMEHVAGWVPYIEVDDLAAQTQSAKDHGAEIIAEGLQGPAGTATFVKDPGGAVLALWKRGGGA